MDKLKKPKAKGKRPKKKMGRPAKPVNWKQVDAMCKILCTDAEICSIMGISPDVLNNNCKKTKGMTFAEYSASKRDGGKMSLRRKMYTRATKDGSDTMLIWLSKNQLGMRDKIDVNNEINGRSEVVLSFDSVKMDPPAEEQDVQQ